MQEYVVSRALSWQLSFYRISKQQQTPQLWNREKEKVRKGNNKKKTFASTQPKKKIQQVRES